MLLIHGDNQVKSRQRLMIKIKTFQGEVVRFDEQVNLTSLKQALESTTLLGGERLVVIEGWPSKAIFDYGKNFKNLLIWVGKTVDGRKLTSLVQSQIEFYKISPAIFAFLDNLNLGTFKRVIKQDSVEMMFFLLARRIRYLLIAKDLGNEDLTEVSPFEKSKILNQAKRYSLEQLIAFYDQLLGIEYSIKSGQTNVPLDLQLELLLASL